MTSILKLLVIPSQTVISSLLWVILLSIHNLSGSTGSVITSQISCSGINLSIKNLLIGVTNLIFLRNYFMRFINKYPVESKYEIQRHGTVFLQMLYFDNYVVCNINSDDANKIVAPCFVKNEIAKPPFTNRINQSSPFPKNLEHAHKVRWCHPFPNRLAERKLGWVTMRPIIQATYHKFLNWLHLVMSTLLVLRILKITYVNVILKIIYSVLRTTHQKFI